MRTRLVRVVPSHLFALVGHGVLPKVCRIHSAIPRGGIMTGSRLHLAGPTSTKNRIPVHFLPLQQVKRRFRQMPRHCADGFRMSFPQPQALVQLADVPFRTTPVVHRHRIRGFGKSPLQIAVHVVAQSCIAHFSAAGVHAWRRPRVTRQVHGARKALHFPNLQPLFQLPHLRFHKIQLRQQLPAHPARLFRQARQVFLQFHAPALPIRIAALTRRYTVLRQCRREPVL